ncbi:hypothetical protein [Kribbella sp. NPDC055071]
MGTQEEEDKTKNDLERVKTENQLKMDNRNAADKKKKEGNQEGQMVAAGSAEAGSAWPDNEVRDAPGKLSQLAGAVGVGTAGDVAFVRDLLNSGQAPLGGATEPAKGGDGARKGIVGSPAAKPALGLG